MSRPIPETVSQESLDAIDAFVGSRIRAARTEDGMSLKELGDYIHVSYQQVQKYENAMTRVAASTLWAFAAKLGCPIWWFFGDRPDGKVDERTLAMTKFFGLPHAARIAELYAQIKKDADRQLIVEFIHRLSNAD